MQKMQSTTPHALTSTRTSSTGTNRYLAILDTRNADSHITSGRHDINQRENKVNMTTIEENSQTHPITAQINIFDVNHQKISCRALIDTCSTTNFMTNDLAKKLRLSQERCNVSVGALNSLSTIANHTIRATIQSRVSNFQRTLTFLIVPNIASVVPDQTVDRTMLKIPRSTELADSRFHRPAPVDILLGAGTALSILCVGQINLSQPDGPDLILQKTMLGWVIGGSVPTAQPNRQATCHTTTTLKLDLARFWEMEEGPQSQHLLESEATCEQHFQNTTTRNTEGRYVVALPFNKNKPKLGESDTQALKRLISLEQKFKRDSELEHQYRAVIQEYLDLGHMSEVHASRPGYYLPHHGVINMSSNTTKLRVVFDGSAVTSTGISLNDTLHTGPKIQDDLLCILLRFRIHQYVITGDIEKMYRQFLVRPEDRQYQRILWRDNKNCVKTYELNTVTFGLSAPPYLAIRCLKQLAQDEGHQFPFAAKILQRDFYVDDALTGASTIQEALTLRNELTQLLHSAGLNIRQWASNDQELLSGLPDQNINQKLHLGESSTIKTLGIVWDSAEDSITYTVKPLTHASRVTKRSISSEIAKIYDPLGLLGPIIIVAKLLL
ncbi:uncharacterized protein LOC143260624 [Megalopta genalis]|uniref:uncharacterized protein LOC143260624 n=1 Tax=Megalopta genalis TaxID=115081 RepID=UPI003FD1148A